MALPVEFDPANGILLLHFDGSMVNAPTLSLEGQSNGQVTWTESGASASAPPLRHILALWLFRASEIVGGIGAKERKREPGKYENMDR